MPLFRRRNPRLELLHEQALTGLIRLIEAASVFFLTRAGAPAPRNPLAGLMEAFTPPPKKPNDPA